MHGIFKAAKKRQVYPTRRAGQSIQPEIEMEALKGLDRQVVVEETPSFLVSVT